MDGLQLGPRNYQVHPGVGRIPDACTIHIRTKIQRQLWQWCGNGCINSWKYIGGYHLGTPTEGCMFHSNKTARHRRYYVSSEARMLPCRRRLSLSTIISSWEYIARGNHSPSSAHTSRPVLAGFAACPVRFRA